MTTLLYILHSSHSPAALVYPTKASVLKTGRNPIDLSLCFSLFYFLCLHLCPPKPTPLLSNLSQVYITPSATHDTTSPCRSNFTSHAQSPGMPIPGHATMAYAIMKALGVRFRSGLHPVPPFQFLHLLFFMHVVSFVIYCSYNCFRTYLLCYCRFSSLADH